jgi:hypothetical protein
MKSSKRRTLNIKINQCQFCGHNKPERKDQGLDPCVSPEGIDIRGGKCLNQVAK